MSTGELEAILGRKDLSTKSSASYLSAYKTALSRGLKVGELMGMEDLRDFADRPGERTR